MLYILTTCYLIDDSIKIDLNVFCHRKVAGRKKKKGTYCLQLPTLNLQEVLPRHLFLPVADKRLIFLI